MSSYITSSNRSSFAICSFSVNHQIVGKRKCWSISFSLGEINLMASTKLILIIEIILAVSLSPSSIEVANCFNLPEKTADLTLLINETLAINNKSIPENGRGKLNSIIKDDWTFDMVEYDLMEFLQDLSARYKLNNSNSNHQESSSPKSSQDEWPMLEGKIGLANTTGAPKSTESFSSINLNVSTSKPAVESTTVTVTTNKELPGTGALATTKPPPPTSPDSLATSLASADHEVPAESSWQYGIFDRFTRPKSSTRPTTPEPQYKSGQDGTKLDVRSFNSEECGLRTYDERKQYFIQQPFPDQESEATKDLIQRRQRLPVVSSPANQERFKQVAGGTLFDNQGDQVEGQRRKTGSGDLEKDAYESYDNAQSTSSQSSQSDADFNLSSRRTWLQQQLGSTLQLLGFNATNPAIADYPNLANSLSVNMRENMMKKSSSGKLGKSMSTNSSDGEIVSEQEEQQRLNLRQDDIKLEARVIGGTDARL